MSSLSTDPLSIRVQLLRLRILLAEAELSEYDKERGLIRGPDGKWSSNGSGNVQSTSKPLKYLNDLTGKVGDKLNKMSADSKQIALDIYNSKPIQEMRTKVGAALEKISKTAHDTYNDTVSLFENASKSIANFDIKQTATQIKENTQKALKSPENRERAAEIALGAGCALAGCFSMVFAIGSIASLISSFPALAGAATLGEMLVAVKTPLVTGVLSKMTGVAASILGAASLEMGRERIAKANAQHFKDIETAFDETGISDNEKAKMQHNPPSTEESLGMLGYDEKETAEIIDAEARQDKLDTSRAFWLSYRLTLINNRMLEYAAHKNARLARAQRAKQSENLLNHLAQEKKDFSLEVKALRAKR